MESAKNVRWNIPFKKFDMVRVKYTILLIASMSYSGVSFLCPLTSGDGINVL